MTQSSSPTTAPRTVPSPAMAVLTRMRLYVVTDASQSVESTLRVVEAACQGGADVVQLRRKSHDALETYRLAERCRVPTAATGTLLIVNDRLDVALAVGADGVHLGQDDLPLPAARRLWPAGIIGCSTHSVEQALAAQEAGADYLGVGPVHATPTKPGRPAVGTALVRALAPRLRVPWVAIGGIDTHTIDEVLDAGARAVAVVRAVCAAADPATATAELGTRVRAVWG